MSSNYAVPSTYSGNWSDWWKLFSDGTNAPKWSNWVDNGRMTPFGNDWMGENLEKNPSNAYGIYNLFGSQGKQNNYSDWLSNQYGNYRSMYQMRTMGDPTLKWTDFLKDIQPEADFNFTSPYKRGESPLYALAPSMRMIR